LSERAVFAKWREQVPKTFLDRLDGFLQALPRSWSRRRLRDVMDIRNALTLRAALLNLSGR